MRSVIEHQTQIAESTTICEIFICTLLALFRITFSVFEQLSFIAFMFEIIFAGRVYYSGPMREAGLSGLSAGVSDGPVR